MVGRQAKKVPMQVKRLKRMQVVNESRDAHFDAGAGVAVPPAPHTHLQVGKPGKPDIHQVKAGQT